MASKSSPTYVYNCEDNPLVSKFEAKRHLLVDPQLNKRLQSLLDTEYLCYVADVTPFIKQLKYKAVCEYQSKLLRSYLEQPKESGLKLDCDRLVLTMACTALDVTKILDKKLGFKHLRIKHLSAILVFVKASVGQANSGMRGSNRPFYNHAFRINVGGNPRKYFNVYVADGNHSHMKSRSVKIDFIPDRFNDFEINLLFSHFKSVLSTNRYNTLIKKAVVTRIDVGFVMPGVINAFVAAYLSESNTKISSCLPIGNDVLPVVETVYIGKKRKSNHFVFYDKLLKEMKSSPVLLSNFKNLAVTARVEYRYYSYRNATTKEPVLVKHMSGVNIPFGNLRILDPLIYLDMNKLFLGSVLTNKTLNNINKVRRDFCKTSEIGITPIQFNAEWVNRAKVKVLTHYKNLLLNPAKVTKSQIMDKLDKVTSTAKPSRLVTSKLKVKKTHKPKDYQIVAVQAPEDVVVVMAGAGTGKTKVIVDRVEYIAKKKKLKSGITVIAFTKESSEEVKGRVGKANLDTHISVSTFNSWCLNSLKHVPDGSYLDYKTFDYDGNENVIVLKDILKKKGLTDVFKASDIKRLYSLKRNRRLSLDQCIAEHAPEFSEEVSNLKAVLLAYKKAKAKKKRFDYEDQLFFMLKHLKTDTIFRHKMLARNKYIIVDELQDMSKLQWRVLDELIEGGCKFFGVGDPAQSIYGFRGADCTHLDIFMKKRTNGKSYPLINNFRSTPQLLELSNFVRTKISKQYQHLLTENSDGLKPTIEECRSINSFADWCLKDIKKKLNNGMKVTDILIVARYHEQVDLIQAVLKKGKVKVESDDPNDKGDLRPSLRGVKVCTIHSAKGRERNVCYLVDPRLSNNAGLETKDEYLKLMYVAVTRAMSELVIAKSMCGQTNYKNAATDDMNILDEILFQKKLYR